ncbi:MAG: heparan-alpha-glucosaminide N-acetyltransferase domain-containing protein [Sphingomonas sp.]
MTAPAHMRDIALDALRGTAIVGMVLANLQGSETNAFPWITHAAWDGLTVADLVFPMFLLAVGLSLPLAQDGREPRVSIGRIVRRAALLWLIGFGISLIVHPSIYREDMRFTGVLQRIGIVYLVCALTVRSTITWKPPAIAALAMLVVHGVLLHLPAPGEIAASMAPGKGMSGWLDRAILGGTRMYGGTFDPEGPLGTLSSIATAMIGVAVQRLAMSAERPMVVWSAGALSAGLLGIAAIAVWPINKALWTPSFALVNAAIGLALLTALKAAGPRIGTWSLLRLIATLGSAALTLYVVHDFVAIALIWKFDVWSLGHEIYGGMARTGMPLAGASMLYAVLAGGLSIAITLRLIRRGWTLRV